MTTDTPGVDGDWAPHRGARVTLTYPPGGKNFDTTRVGTIMKVEQAGFHVCVQPSGQLIYVDYDNYRAQDASWRGWDPKDGWPIDRSKPKEKKKN